MLLTRLIRVIRRARREDEGAALAAVVGLMATSLLLTALVSTSVISSAGFTSAVRADVQSQAAAEAGIADARAGLVNGTCIPSLNRYVSPAGTTPRYVATVWVPLGSGWVQGCPILSTQARILSTGYAASTGVNGATAENSTNIEVILSTVVGSSSITASGPAIYSYDAQNFGGGGKLTSVNGSSPSVMTKTGNLVCDGGAEGAVNVVVESGNLDINGGCKIAGSAWASGRVKVDGGTVVGGNVIGNGVTVNSTVNGSVWSTADLTMSGNPTVGGNATAASLTIQGNINGSAWIYGNSTLNWTTRIGGNLTTKTLNTPSNSFVQGSTSQTSPNTPAASPFATPTRPIVPNWVDYNYDKSKWQGFTEVVLSPLECSYLLIKARLLLYGTTPILLDARSCSSVTINGADILDLGGDLAIFANKFDFSGGGGISVSTSKRLWLINPDTVANSQPTCGAGQSLSVSGGFSFNSNISVMMYTPCRINIGSSTNVRGQVYSGLATIDGGSRIGYVAVGLPGVDLDTGTVSVPAGTESNRTIVSSRNVQVGN